MIRYKILCFLLIFLKIQASAQWESLGDNLIPPNHRVYSIKIAPDQSIWALSTFDAFPPTNQLPEVHRSADGGENWIHTAIPEASSSYGNDISPIDSLTAFIALDTAGLYQTVDGGQTWSEVQTYPFDAIYVHFFNQNEGWVLGIDTTIQQRLAMSLTTDGGQTWIHSGHGIGQAEGTSIPINTNDFIVYAFSFNSAYDVSGNTIIMGRSAGNYWRSDDKGYHWTNHTTPLFDFGLMTSNVAIKDENTFMVAGDILFSNHTGSPAKNYTTKDGGLTWIEGRSGMTTAATRYVPDSDSVFVTVGHANFGWGEAGTAISYDYGETWERINSTSLIAIDFLDQNNGVGTCCNNIWPTANGQIHKWNFDLPTSVETLDVTTSNSLTIMPNPVINDLSIVTNDIFKSSKYLWIDIVSFDGKLMKRGKYSHNGRSLFISTKELPAGFYMLRVTNQDKMVVEKFIKE